MIREGNQVHFVHVDHLKSAGCKLPGPVSDNGAQFGGLPHEKKPEFRGPMTSGSSVSLKSRITGCSASTPQNFAGSAGFESMEDFSVPK